MSTNEMGCSRLKSYDKDDFIILKGIEGEFAVRISSINLILRHISDNATIVVGNLTYHTWEKYTDLIGRLFK